MPHTLLLAWVSLLIGDRTESADSKFASTMCSAIKVIADEFVTAVPRSQLATWAIEGLHEELKKPVPPELIQGLERLGKATDADMLKLFRDAYSPLFSDTDADFKKALAAGLSNVFRKLEPGARSKDRSGWSQREIVCILRRTDLVGIGLKVRPEPVSGMLEVVTPIFKGPAYMAGLGAGDIITHIRIGTDLDGKPLARPKEHSTVGMTPQQAQELFLGQIDTSVTLRVIRAR